LLNWTRESRAKTNLILEHLKPLIEKYISKIQRIWS